MVFNPKTVFGLCNVLYRHAKHIDLIIFSEDTSQHEIEQWAKRMDLIYRDSFSNWQVILKEPNAIIDNLESIDQSSADFISKLYDVEPSIQKQLSRGFGKGGFVKFRSTMREQCDRLKGLINEVRSLFDDELNSGVSPESIAALDAAIDVWKSSNTNKNVPKNLKRNLFLKKFIFDCFEIFGIKSDLDQSYQIWYKLNYK